MFINLFLFTKVSNIRVARTFVVIFYLNYISLFLLIQFTLATFAFFKHDELIVLKLLQLYPHAASPISNLFRTPSTNKDKAMVVEWFSRKQNSKLFKIMYLVKELYKQL